MNYITGGKDLTSNSKTLPKNFCSAPWTAIYVNPRGFVGPCCIFDLDHTTTYGDLNKDSIEEVLNSESANKLKLQFMNNEKPQACKSCWNNEDINLESFRNFWLSKDEKIIQDILNYTTDTGQNKHINVNYWDIRPNNICNLGCIMCSPELSSGVWQLRSELDSFVLEKNRVKNISDKFIKIKNDNFSETLEYVKKTIISNQSNEIIDHFYFAGGEPLIMPEHKQIINMLEKENFYHVTLRYNTNVTSIVFKDINWVNIWKKFSEKVIIDLSIDATGETASIQRVGTNWDIIEKNLKILASNKNIQVTFNIVVSILTYPKLVETLIKLEEIFGNEHLIRYARLTPLTEPKFLCLNSIDDQYIDYSILDKVNNMGYTTTSIQTLLNNRLNFVQKNNMDLIKTERLKFFTGLYKIKNLDVRTILPWIEFDE